ncbi:hypothetical protein LTR94_033682, partial [Friedmanniomyces endolithicus]
TDRHARPDHVEPGVLPAEELCVAEVRPLQLRGDAGQDRDPNAQFRLEHHPAAQIGAKAIGADAIGRPVVHRQPDPGPHEPPRQADRQRHARRGEAGVAARVRGYERIGAQRRNARVQQRLAAHPQLQ